MGTLRRFFRHVVEILKVQEPKKKSLCIEKHLFNFCNASSQSLAEVEEQIKEKFVKMIVQCARTCHHKKPKIRILPREETLNVAYGI